MPAVDGDRHEHARLGSLKVEQCLARCTGLMRQTVFRDLHTLYPDQIVNKTNDTLSSLAVRARS